MKILEGKAVNEEKERFSSKPPGYLLGRFGLLAMLAGLVLAAWYGQIVIVILLALTPTTISPALGWMCVASAILASSAVRLRRGVEPQIMQ